MEWLRLFIPPSQGPRTDPIMGLSIMGLSSSIFSSAKGAAGRAVYWDLSTISCTVLMRLLMKVINLFNKHDPKVSSKSKIIRGPVYPRRVPVSILCPSVLQK